MKSTSAALVIQVKSRLLPLSPLESALERLIESLPRHLLGIKLHWKRICRHCNQACSTIRLMLFARCICLRGPTKQDPRHCKTIWLLIMNCWVQPESAMRFQPEQINQWEMVNIFMIRSMNVMCSDRHKPEVLLWKCFFEGEAYVPTS